MSVEASPDSAAVPSSSFGPLRQIDAGLLNVGYVDIGPAEGQVVVLLHGWPYDIHSHIDVSPGLAEAGYRVIVPFCAVSGPRGSCQMRPSATASRRCRRSMSSR